MQTTNQATFSLAEANTIAEKLGATLAPYTKWGHIAGSIRRQKSFVKDIEIVCLPLSVTNNDLFGGASSRVISPEWEKAVMSFGKVIKGHTTGRYMQIELPEGIILDLFLPEEHDYYRQLAIRTGSSEYAAKVIAGSWKRIGWVGTEQGLRRRTECIEIPHPNSSSTWKCTKSNPTRPPDWQSEEEFFKWLGVKWIAPPLRNI